MVMQIMTLLENLSLLHAAVAVAVLYLAWLLLSHFVLKSPLANVPGPPTDSLLTGNLAAYASRHCWEWRAALSRKYGRVAVIWGLFNARWVVTHDPKALHAMLIKDADIYEEPIWSLRLLLGPGLLSTLGDQHRKQRKMLNPVFSTKHLRDMTPLFFEIVHKTRDALVSRVRAGTQGEKGANAWIELDMLSWMGRTTLEVLGQAGLGHSFDPLTEDVPDNFATAVKEFFPQLAKSIVLRLLLPTAMKFGSATFRRRVVDMIPVHTVQRLKDISDIMHARSVLIFNEKKAQLARGDEALKHQVGEGRDIMSILLRANMAATDQERLEDDEIIAQVSTMVLAGMDTTANSLARILLLLAEHPDVQERLRAEILQAVELQGNGDVLDFDTLMELPYLDAVCRETLRVHGGVASTFRDTLKDVVLPLSEPIRGRDGTLISAIPIPKGTRVVAELWSANRDTLIWGPDADQWRPERWLEELPKAVEEARMPGVYSPLMTFSGGGRACIGFKFAQVEMKAVLCVLIQYLKFEPTGKPIAWNFAAVQYPTVGKESQFPEMPLRVSLLRP
ncbi:cytochrome P450 [Trametes punicea]|nr:cytochrome P450 [Trametes punicea]